MKMFKNARRGLLAALLTGMLAIGTFPLVKMNQDQGWELTAVQSAQAQIGANWSITIVPTLCCDGHIWHIATNCVHGGSRSCSPKSCPPSCGGGGDEK